MTSDFYPSGGRTCRRCGRINTHRTVNDTLTCIDREANELDWQYSDPFEQRFQDAKIAARWVQLWDKYFIEKGLGSLFDADEEDYKLMNKVNWKRCKAQQRLINVLLG